MPDDDWFQKVRTFADDLGARLAVLVQVKRDAAKGAAIAERLEAELVPWADHATHADQERIARDLYRRSVAVVSDRIHALIIGYTEGAVPIGVTTSSPAKLARTFEVVTSQPVSPLSDVEELARWRSLIAARAALLDDLETARTALSTPIARIGGRMPVRSG